MTPSRKEKAKLKGTWVLVSLEQDGKAQPLPANGRFTMTFQGDKLIATEGVTKEATYSIDPTKQPAHLDIIPADDPDKGEPAPLIYVIDKDELKICGATLGALGRDGERPKEFATKEG